MVMPDSRASSNPMIRAWYSAALFGHGSSSEKACGVMYLSRLTKRMPIPDIGLPRSFLLVAPSKYMLQKAFDEEVSTLWASSSGRSSLSGESLGSGCSARKSARAWPLIAFCGTYRMSNCHRRMDHFANRALREAAFVTRTFM
ncbi:hypothetical protein AAC387_Pa04g1464 [Persea americana]